MDVVVIEPNPYPNNPQRTGPARAIAPAPSAYRTEAWVVIEWPDGLKTREPVKHVKKHAV